jgi:hypothetical protein
MPSEYIPVIRERGASGFFERNPTCLGARVGTASESNDVDDVAVLVYGSLKITYAIVNAGFWS